MRCFYHADREAVGVCKSCQRAICHECISDVGKGIACKDRCEEDVRQIVRLTEAVIRDQPMSEFVLGRVKRNRIVSSIFYIVLGGGFIVTGVVHPYLQFTIFLGAVFVLYGIYTVSQLSKVPSKVIDGTSKT
jgi:hypothetical protein